MRILPYRHHSEVDLFSPSSSFEKQPSTLHFLTHAFPSLLSRLSHSPEARLSSVLSSAAAFSHPTPSTAEDTSTTSQVRSLEAHIGRRALSLPSIDEAGIVPVNSHHVLAAGRTELARRTGSKPNTRAGAAQLIKLREESERVAAEGRTQKGVLDSARTGRIVLESGLLAGCFLGRCVRSFRSSFPSLFLSALQSSDLTPFLFSQASLNRRRRRLLHRTLRPGHAGLGRRASRVRRERKGRGGRRSEDAEGDAWGSRDGRRSRGELIIILLPSS